MADSEIGPDLAGLRFISDAVTPFGLSAMYQETYPINAAKVIDPTDPEEGYEGWLYDRCTTFLSFYAHTGDTRFLREGYRLCSYYADHIELNGENRGIFTGKPEPDPKYSHLRGLYAYYALTGDEAALAAGNAIAERFLADQEFVAPYREGHARGPDKLWTERLLAVSLEALYYGHRLTGDAVLPRGDRGAGRHRLPPHHRRRRRRWRRSTRRHRVPAAELLHPHRRAGGRGGRRRARGAPAGCRCCWSTRCSPTRTRPDDPRVDEIFIRLTRFLRDVGTRLLHKRRQQRRTTPSSPGPLPSARRRRGGSSGLLVPLYGAGYRCHGPAAQCRRVRRLPALPGCHRDHRGGMRALTADRRLRPESDRAVRLRGRVVPGPAPGIRLCAAWRTRRPNPASPRPSHMDGSR